MTTATITKTQVVLLLLEASPSARPAWEAHLAWWKGGQAGDFNDATVCAHHIVDSYAKGETAQLGALFAALERILSEGDTEARRPTAACSRRRPARSWGAAAEAEHVSQERIADRIATTWFTSQIRHPSVPPA
jgi:hypothetical protein